MKEQESEMCLGKLVDTVLLKLENETETRIPPECRGFVERALRIKDGSVDKAANLLVYYSQAIKLLRDMYERWDPQRCINLFISVEGSRSEEVMTILKSRDNEGHQVLLTKFGNWDPQRNSFDDIITGIMLLFCWVVGQSHATQRKGIVYLFDLSNFGLKQMRGAKIARLKDLVGLVQDSAPGRIKDIHLIFHPRIFHILFHITKPFLKDKLTRRIHFHGDDLGKLHQHFPANSLPESLGGTLDEQDAFDLHLIQKFINDESFSGDIVYYGVPRY